MKAGLAAIMVTALGILAPSAQAAAPSAAPSASTISTDDLPLTPRFATLLTGYRNCVLMQIDQAPLGSQQDMAAQAMSACALSRSELQSQLLSDLRAAHPAATPTMATRVAAQGVAQIDPMIEEAAVAQAHARYARTMR